MRTFGDMPLERLLAFGQNQFSPRPLPTSCFSFSIAIITNLLLGDLLLQGQDLDGYLVRHMFKNPFFGIPSFRIPHALKGVQRYYRIRQIKLSYRIARQSYESKEALINNLEEGIPTIAEVSWGKTTQCVRDLFTNGPAKAVGHYLVLAGYEPKQQAFYFLDPGNGGLSRYADRTLEKIWLQQPNLFIEKGSAIIFCREEQTQNA